MGKLLFLYAGPNGGIFRNDDVLPLGALKSLHGEDGPFLRFCLDLDGDRFYIQDESFRREMASGSPRAWGMLNLALAWADEKHGIRFPKRAFGDPPGSSTRRRLSQYGRAWSYITEFLRAEFKTEPSDMDVTEYVPEGADEGTVSLGDDGIRVNRYMNRAWEATGKATGDVDYDLINDELAAFFLARSSDLAASSPDSFKWLPAGKADESYFACRVGGEPRSFKSGGHDEAAIREKAGIPASDAVMTFTINPSDREICLGNCIPSVAKRHDQELLDAVLGMAAKHIGVSPSSVVVTFAPGLSRPFVSKLSRYRAAWGAIADMGWPAVDVPVIEVPIRPAGGRAALIRSHDEEDGLVPGLARYRVTHGIEATYPYIAADSRESGPRKARSLLVEFSRLVPEANDEASKLPPGQFMAAMRDPVRAKRALAAMSNLMAMGMSESEALDVMAGYDDLLKRAEYRRLLRAAKMAKVASRVADMGPGLGINDWWHIGLQEGLNRSQHVNDKPEKPKKAPSYNRKKKAGPMPLEGLLGDKRDKNAPAQKGVEQLLRESRV
jgi:hypothetical protein